MRFLYSLLLLAITFCAHAQSFPPSWPVQATGGSISGSLAGMDGSGLLITPPSATVPMTASALWSTPIDVRSYGAICDGTTHSGNLDAVHLAAAMAIGNLFKTIIDLPPNCKWGTNTTNQAETPIVLQDNTTLRVFGKQIMAVNNSATQGLIVTKSGYSDGDTVSATAVDVIGMAGNWLDTVSRTDLSVSWKMVVLGNCNTCSVRGLNISTTTFLGSFAIQGRNPTDVTIENNRLRMMPSPDGKAGGDGIHATGNIDGWYVHNNDAYSVDDTVSVTEENSTMAGKIARNIRIIGNKLRTYAFSGIKFFTGNGAGNSAIQDVIIDGNQISVWGPKGVDGNCMKVQQELGKITGIRMGVNTCDDSNGAGVAVLATAATPCGVDNSSWGQFTVANYPFRGIEHDGNVCNFDGSKAIVGPFASPTTIIPSVGIYAIIASGTNAGIIYLTSGTDISAVSTGGTQFIYASGMNLRYNLSSFGIIGKDVSNSTLTVRATGITSATNEVGVSGTGVIIDRTSGAAIYDRGSYASRWDGATIIDPPLFGYQFTTYNGNSYVISATEYYAQDTAKVTISPSVVGGLASLLTESDKSGYFSTTSFTSPINNYTNGKILQVSATANPPFVLVRVPGITSATNEYNKAAMNVSGTLCTGACGSSLYLPTDTVLKNTTIISQTAGTGIALQAGQSITIDSNHCLESGADLCGSEVNSANLVSGSIITNNRDDGLSRMSRTSWSWASAKEAYRFLNTGTNPDWFSGVRDLGAINSSLVSATTVSVTSNLAAANVSVTAGVLRAFSISATAISSTGNISAAQFMGDGSLLTGVVASASPGGSNGMLQYNLNGITSGTSGITFNPSSTDLAINSNLTVAAQVSASKVLATNSGTCSSASVQVQSANNGLYRPVSNAMGACAGGTEALRMTTTTVSTSLNLTVGGSTISTSLAGAASASLCVGTSGVVYRGAPGC